MKKQTEKITLRLLRDIPDNFVGEIWDSEIRGFYVRIGKNGISFCVRKFHNGKMFDSTIGHYPLMTVEESRTEALKFLSSLANYEIPEAITAHKQPTIGEAIDWYIEHNRFPRRVKPFFVSWTPYRNKKIAEMKRSDVMAVRNSFGEKVQMSNHVVLYLSIAISKFSKTLDIDLPNPAKGIEKFHVEPRKRFLSDTEAPKLMNALRELQQYWRCSAQADALLMMIFTGQRKSNVLSMNLSEIDARGVWTIPYDKAKGKRDIIVPLNEYAMKIVESRKATALNGYVFHYRGHVLSDVSKTMEKACQMAGIENCHVHDLRRTLGSWMLMNGTPIEVVSRTLGHSSIAVTEQVYAHLLPKKISTATEAAVDAMMRGSV